MKKLKDSWFFKYFLDSDIREYSKLLRDANVLDQNYYLSRNEMNFWHRLYPEKHYAIYGEHRGFKPNSQFSPHAYIMHNPDLMIFKTRPTLHYIKWGINEDRKTDYYGFEADAVFECGHLKDSIPAKKVFFIDKKEYAVVVHIFYTDLWAEIEKELSALEIEFDLYITLGCADEERQEMRNNILRVLPNAAIIDFPNHGRDVYPFIQLINYGYLDDYTCVCKIHTKKSLHRDDGDFWRQHLIRGILQRENTGSFLKQFLKHTDSAVWVSEGQNYSGEEWVGSNTNTLSTLALRSGIIMNDFNVSFPAGSMYWVKPLIIDMLRSTELEYTDFEVEDGQIDGTVAHAIERLIGVIVSKAGMRIIDTPQLFSDSVSEYIKPSYISAFYLPQFHQTPENNLWWGKGFTEWTNVTAAVPNYTNHDQPFLPGALGFYDLQSAEIMRKQYKLAKEAGINAFCVYLYWFDEKCLLDQPMQNILKDQDIEFPFYLCWANESWRRNWDGQSGEILMEQKYSDGFEVRLASYVKKFMADKRYQKPDGERPRFIIYRPDDMPYPEKNIQNIREAFTEEVGEKIEIGAVLTHWCNPDNFDSEIVDFWVEMPPHRAVQSEDIVFNESLKKEVGVDFNKDYRGLAYDYESVIFNLTKNKQYLSQLPANTIAGIMPSWDNTARRGSDAHFAYQATPASFALFLREIYTHRMENSYRQELFINAWNEWAEKAVLEPSAKYGYGNIHAINQFCP